MISFFYKIKNVWLKTISYPSKNDENQCLSNYLAYVNAIAHCPKSQARCEDFV